MNRIDELRRMAELHADQFWAFALAEAADELEGLARAVVHESEAVAAAGAPPLSWGDAVEHARDDTVGRARRLLGLPAFIA